MISALGVFGCSSSDAINQNTVKAANSSSNAEHVVQILPGNTSSNTITVPAANADRAGLNSSNAEAQPEKSIPAPAIEAQPINQPAPDGSTVSVALGNDLVETRTFKNPSQIIKVEETLIGATPGGKKTIKVYFKNGQVKEIPEGKVGDAMTESAGNLLKAAGGQ